MTPELPIPDPIVCLITDKYGEPLTTKEDWEDAHARMDGLKVAVLCGDAAPKDIYSRAPNPRPTLGCLVEYDDLDDWPWSEAFTRIRQCLTIADALREAYKT